jgi:hypothetical protein
MEDDMSLDSVLSRVAKTLAYFPFEDEHVEESAGPAWLFLGMFLALGILASGESVVFGIGLTCACLYGGALARYIISRWD